MLGVRWMKMNLVSLCFHFLCLIVSCSSSNKQETFIVVSCSYSAHNETQCEKDKRHWYDQSKVACRWGDWTIDFGLRVAAVPTFPKVVLPLPKVTVKGQYHISRGKLCNCSIVLMNVRQDWHQTFSICFFSYF